MEINKLFDENLCVMASIVSTISLFQVLSVVERQFLPHVLFSPVCDNKTGDICIELNFILKEGTILPGYSNFQYKLNRFEMNKLVDEFVSS